MNHTYLTYVAGLKSLQSSGHTSPQQSNLWLQQQPANDAGCFTVAAIGGEHVCMFMQDAWVPTHTNEIYHICHVISLPLPYFFPFYFLGGRGWPGEEATLDMSLFLARVEVNLVGRCFLLTSTAADKVAIGFLHLRVRVL